ncbi:hypothetical protein HY230_06680 [Candidatus Acetothermia bacterium]|nr:hypothetical protein [Candidatus Acetothermia bacterium]
MLQLEADGKLRIKALCLGTVFAPVITQNPDNLSSEGDCRNSWSGTGGGGGGGISGWVDDGAIVRLATASDSVGIGTASPGAKLDITDTATARLRLSAGGTGGRIYELESFTTSGLFGISDITASGTPTRFVINSSGNVGIGTINPSALLSVVKSGAPEPSVLGVPTALKVGTLTGTIPLALRQNAAESATPTLAWFETASGGLGFLGTASNTFVVGAATGKQLALRVNLSTTGMTIDTSGNVLVGAQNPAPGAKLTVGGDIFTLGKMRALLGFNGKCRTDGDVADGPVCNQDLAEAFASAEPTEPGDLVVLMPQAKATPTVRKSAQPYEGLLVGVVSSNPGLVFDHGETYLAGDNSNLITKDKTIVAAVGRVSLKVSMENGPIAVGDPLTSSSKLGIAMKATKAGKIIGYALENADKDGKILIWLQPGMYIPDNLLEQLNQLQSK